MKLFSKNFGSVSTDEELASLQQQFPNYDPGYITQAAGLPRLKMKKWMEKLWKKYEPYADSNFSKEFEHQFSQRSWELYFGATLLNRGLRLGQHNNIGPDFDIRNDKGKRLAWIEATVTEKGKGNDKVPNIAYGVAINLPEKEMLFRIANVLNEKFRIYKKELKEGIIKNNEPYVIAINRAPLDYVDSGIPLILKALFGIGYQTLRIMVGGVRQKKAESSWTARQKISKQNGSDVPMLFFEDSSYSGISAVIYCSDSILDSPSVPKEMGENFIIIHNPLAKNLLPDGLFPFGDEYKVEGKDIKKIRSKKTWNKFD